MDGFYFSYLLRFYWYLYQTDFCIKFANNRIPLYYYYHHYYYYYHYLRRAISVRHRASIADADRLEFHPEEESVREMRLGDVRAVFYLLAILLAAAVAAMVAETSMGRASRKRKEEKSCRRVIPAQDARTRRDLTLTRSLPLRKLALKIL